MFHINVLGTDSFLDMPHSTQSLYIQCGMRADDDGFVDDMKQILKVTNTTTDDIAILLAKGYLHKVCTNPVQNAQEIAQNLHNSVQNAQVLCNIYLIAHWNLCNSVRKDCYTQSSHFHLLDDFVLQSNKIYIRSNVQPNLFNPSEIAQDFVQRNETVPQIRLDKIRLDKNICATQFAQFWKLYPKKINKKRAEDEWMRANITPELFERIMKHLEARIKTSWIKNNKAYVVYPERFIKYEKWEDDLSAYEEDTQNEEGQLLDLSTSQ